MADKNEGTKIGFDPVKEHDRCLDTRAYIGAKTKKLQSRVKQIENRLNKEIAEKEGLLQDIEDPIDLKVLPLTHHKDILCLIKDYSVKYGAADKCVFENVNLELHQQDRLCLAGKNGCGKSTYI